MSAPGEGSRTAFVVGLLLLVSLATTGLLAWQAHRAVRLHRDTAEAVLRDYARLAAEELVRQATSSMGYRGYYRVMTTVPSGLDSAEALESAVERALAEADEPLRSALGLASRYFVLPAGAKTLELTGDDPVALDLREWLSRELPSKRDQDGPYGVAHGVLNGEPVSAIFRNDVDTGTIAGFLVELGAFREHFESLLKEEPLLPPSLGRGEATNEALFVAFRDHGGIERFRSGERFVPRFGVEMPFGKTYQGVFEGSSVRVSIDPEAAAALVIGGLPPSRVPLLLGLLLVNAGLLVTAVLQLRRERQLQRLRSEFVASASHELRTPLTHIRMFAETLLLGRTRSEGEHEHSLRIIDREVRRLSHIVDNLLQFSRAERQTLSLAVERGKPEPKIRETLELFQPLAVDSGARVVARLDADVDAMHDPDALGQILLNLLDNAVKYGPPDQEVLVGLESDNGVARLVVEDEGPGIPPRERRRIFERFYRIARDRDSVVAGTGVGLSVVHELVTLQGGRVFVEPGERGGSRFVVELPTSPEELQR